MLNHRPQHHVYMCSKYLQGWWFKDFPGQPMSVPDNTFIEETFPNVQPKHPPVQLEVFFSRLLTCCLGEETNASLTTTFFQVAVLIFSKLNNLSSIPSVESWQNLLVWKKQRKIFWGTWMITIRMTKFKFYWIAGCCSKLSYHYIDEIYATYSNYLWKDMHLNIMR